MIIRLRSQHIALALALAGVSGFSLAQPVAAGAATATAVAPRLPQPPQPAPMEAFTHCIAQAIADAEANQPAKALANYQRALTLAGTSPARTRIALFGVGHMQIWLGQYVQAQQTYQTLLAQPLTAADHAAALAGLMRSLSFQNRPRLAYGQGTGVTGLASPQLALEQARAALWAGWPDKAQTVISRQQAAWQQIHAGSFLGREQREIERQLKTEMQPSVRLENHFADDNSGLTARQTTVTGSLPLPDKQHVTLAAQDDALTQQGETRGKTVLLGYNRQLNDDWQVGLNVGGAHFGDWSPWLDRLSIRYHPDDFWQARAYTRKELVMTPAAIRQQVASRTTGLDFSLFPTARLNVNQSFFQQRFSDDNERYGMASRVNWLLSDAWGLGLQGRFRYFTDNGGVNGLYFNPDRFQEEQVLLTWARRIAGDWRLSLTAGPGWQSFTGSAGQHTDMVELTAQGPVVGCLSAAGSLGYTDSAADTASGYRQRYAGISLACAW